jgi:hypothetical protein
MDLPHFPHFMAIFGLPLHPAAVDSGCGFHFTGERYAD